MWRASSTVLFPFALVASCARTPSPIVGEPRSIAPSVETAAVPSNAPSAEPPPIASSPAIARSAPSKDTYPWLASEGAPRVDGSLEDRFAPPDGFRRVEVAPGSFAAFLRGLPLAPPHTPVLAYDGHEVLPADDEHLAAVVAIDVGSRDLQQCADSIIRLHGEWRFSRGAEDVIHRASSDTALSYAAFLRGERPAAHGNDLTMSLRAAPSVRSHDTFRAFLDVVFEWANTASLSRETSRPAIRGIRGGDFFVMPRYPVGHAVLTLDVARDAEGRTMLLLGQGFMPAQNFHVLRFSRERVWFPLDERAGEIETPFWSPFPFETLRRFEGS